MSPEGIPTRSAHERPQQRPVSLDHGTERIRLAGVFPNEPLKDADFLLQAGQRQSGERHAAEVLGCGFAHAGQRGADDGGGQW